MPRNTLAEHEVAEAFYLDRIMPLLKEVFVEREGHKVHREYEGLIMSVGDSYPPLVLSVVTLRPRRVCFLYTEQTEPYLDTIVILTGLRPSQYDKKKVVKDDALGIYQAIKDVYESWGRPASVAVDFTGGTKVMSTGAAMAGVIINADFVYIASSRYSSRLRRPYPGSESLEFISNPYEVMGDLEEAQGLELMRLHDYAGARRVFARLRERVPEPRRYEVLELLARACEEWDNLELERAETHLGELIGLVGRYGRTGRDFVLWERLAHLDQQHRALRTLREGLEQLRGAVRREGGTAAEVLSRKEFVQALMGTLYCNALRREEQNKLDMAALLLYRLLELVEQAALAGYGLDTAAPDYSVVDMGADELAARFTGLRAGVYGREAGAQGLPARISLVDGYVLLAALGDPLTENLDWQRLRGLVDQRNFGIFAHGFDFIRRKDYEAFKKLVRELVDRYLERFGTDLARLAERFGFVSL